MPFGHLMRTAIAALCVLASSLAAANPPLKLDVPSGARPIWSPTRPAESIGEPTEQKSDAADTLRFVAAGWGQDASTGTTSSPSVVLRWRSRKPTAAFHEAGSTAKRPSAAWRNPNATESTVRLASHDAPVDPFDDPFGDRLAQDSGADSLPPLETSKPDRNSTFAPPADFPSPSADSPSPPAETDTPSDMAPPNLTEPAETSKEPAVPPAEQRQPLAEPSTAPSLRLPPDSPGPAVPPAQADPLEPQPPAPPLKMSAPSVAPPASVGAGEAEGDAAPCKRIYNERDCCQEDEKCSTARQALRRNSIKNISLDITASFRPDAKTLEEERQKREDQLRLMPTHVWRNRDGQKVVEGRLTELHGRRAVVAGTDGNVVAIPFGELSDDDLCFLAAWWGVPTECTLGDDQFPYRNWEPVTFAWKASALCHKPLYFEQAQLERYGHTTGPVLQPVVSGAHFFLNIATLPYKMGINPANECQYSLGYYRPGSCAPRLLPPVPLSVRGGLLQAGAITGLVLLFP